MLVNKLAKGVLAVEEQVPVAATFISLIIGSTFWGALVGAFWFAIGRVTGSSWFFASPPSFRNTIFLAVLVMVFDVLLSQMHPAAAALDGFVFSGAITASIWALHKLFPKSTAQA